MSDLDNTPEQATNSKLKRSAFLDLNLMRKRSRAFILAPISLAVISACSSPDNSETVQFVTSVDDCTSSTELSQEACQAAYEKAVQDAEATAPRYRSERDCINEFGQCQSSGGFFMPFMTGYIVSSMISDSMDRKRYRHSHPAYMYRGSGSLRNKIMTSDGFVVGSPGQRSYKMPREALAPKPAVTRTISRGGFGAKASAKSNWGSSRASGSSRSGWGG
jgi:uncharacterized protein YgiB involved in biofilm formation